MTIPVRAVVRYTYDRAGEMSFLGSPAPSVEVSMVSIWGMVRLGLSAFRSNGLLQNVLQRNLVHDCNGDQGILVYRRHSPGFNVPISSRPLDDTLSFDLERLPTNQL